ASGARVVITRTRWPARSIARTSASLREAAGVGSGANSRVATTYVPWVRRGCFATQGPSIFFIGSGQDRFTVAPARSAPGAVSGPLAQGVDAAQGRCAVTVVGGALGGGAGPGDGRGELGGVAHEAVPAVLERLDPLGLGAHRRAGGAQQVRLLLQAAGIGDHRARMLHGAHELGVGDGLADVHGTAASSMPASRALATRRG